VWRSSGSASVSWTNFRADKNVQQQFGKKICASSANKKWIPVDCAKRLGVICEERNKVATDWAKDYDLLWKLDTARKFRVIASSGDPSVSIKTAFLNVQLTEQTDQARQIIHPEELLEKGQVTLMDLFSPNLSDAALVEPSTFNHLVWSVPAEILLLILVIVLC